ncbi:uncharacterized protein LOC142317642 [Lycorma delicatula]|uniref:uncharacterized protein LOC142317642 n=1 Tax=Lycorma delicatula TaxID=130591 RepID=UPI003F51516A
MSVEIPTWLTKDYIKTALQHDENTKNILSIENMEIDNPVASGNNGTCLIYRVKAEYKVKYDKNVYNISLIFKVPTKSGLHEFVSNSGLYKKENMIYHELIPKYNLILGDKFPKISPKAYYSTEEDIVILEDLKIRGYIMPDRVKQLGFEESKVALSCLAIFHAASVKLYETKPELIKKCGVESLFREDVKEFFSGMTKGLIHKAANECEKRPDLKKYVEGLRKVGDCLFDIHIELFKPKESELNVLNHGDFWMGNMMFKYIDNKPIEFIPIDLQICRYANPVLDIIYFLYGSVREEVRIEKYDDLLNIYLNKLNNYLEIFESKKKLNKYEFKKALDYYDFGTTTSITTQNE